MKKLPAFTIIELMMTMLISSIVIGIAYYAFSLMSTRFAQFYTKSDTIGDYRLFRKIIQKDMGEAEAVTIAENSRVLDVRFVAKESVNYYFNDSCIIRHQLQTSDTFRLRQTLDSLHYLNDTVPLISRIYLSFHVEKESVPLAVSKEYSSKELAAYYLSKYE